MIGFTIGPLWVRPMFEWRDLWLGVYVKEPYWEGGSFRQVIYVCVVPMLPILIEWERRRAF